MMHVWSSHQGQQLVELEVATAVALFDRAFGPALPTLVGVLIEVPVMVSFVAHWK